MGREIRVLADGIYFGEGPRWHDGRLWFSDFFAQAVKSVSPAGDLRTEFEIDDRPSGLGWMPDGSMLVVSMAKRRVLRRFPDGRVAVHAELGGIATFHCNDMVVDAAGRAYVGDFGFDIDAEFASRGAAAVMADHMAAKLALVLPDGTAKVAAQGLSFPNGLAITPDGRTLIVAETLGSALAAFDIAADGLLSSRRVWAPTAPRVPDGISLDAEGAVWFANPLAPECVRIGEGGQVLETVETQQPCFACMLGGKDGRCLFMLTAPTFEAREAAAEPRGKVLAAVVDSPGAGWP